MNFELSPKEFLLGKTNDRKVFGWRYKVANAL